MWPTVATAVAGCALLLSLAHMAGILPGFDGNGSFDFTLLYIGLPSMLFAVVSVAWGQPLRGFYPTAADIDEFNIESTMRDLKEKHFGWQVTALTKCLCSAHLHNHTY